MPTIKKPLRKASEGAETQLERIEWDGVPPHHFIDPVPQGGVLRVSSSILEEASLRRRDFARESFTEALRVVIADRYAACLRWRDTNPQTGTVWSIEDVPVYYRGLVDVSP